MVNSSLTQTNATNCGSRLPCGLCLITNRPCPYLVQTEITWNEVTCGTTGTTTYTTGKTDTVTYRTEGGSK